MWRLLFGGKDTQVIKPGLPQCGMLSALVSLGRGELFANPEQQLQASSASAAPAKACLCGEPRKKPCLEFRFKQQVC